MFCILRSCSIHDNCSTQCTDRLLHGQVQCISPYPPGGNASLKTPLEGIGSLWTRSNVQPHAQWRGFYLKNFKRSSAPKTIVTVTPYYSEEREGQRDRKREGEREREGDRGMQQRLNDLSASAIVPCDHVSVVHIVGAHAQSVIGDSHAHAWRTSKRVNDAKNV